MHREKGGYQTGKIIIFNRGDLKFGLVWILNGQKEVGLKFVLFQIVWFLNGRPIISHLDCEDPKNAISKLMAHFGKVVSEPEEILYDVWSFNRTLSMYLSSVNLFGSQD